MFVVFVVKSFKSFAKRFFYVFFHFKMNAPAGIRTRAICYLRTTEICYLEGRNTAIILPAHEIKSEKSFNKVFLYYERPRTMSLHHSPVVQQSWTPPAGFEPATNRLGTCYSIQAELQGLARPASLKFQGKGLISKKKRIQKDYSNISTRSDSLIQVLLLEP